MKNKFQDDRNDLKSEKVGDIVISKEILFFIKWIFLKKDEKNIKKFIFKEWENGFEEFYLKEKLNLDLRIEDLVSESIEKYIKLFNKIIFNLINKKLIESNDLEIINCSNDLKEKPFKVKAKKLLKNNKNKEIINKELIDFLKNWNPENDFN